MKSVKESHKKNLVHKQVVAGKEFKGTAFIAKPDVILFKVPSPSIKLFPRTLSSARSTGRRS